MPSPLVETEALSRRFGALRALDELTLTIGEGEWVAITGPSGSGKTTLLNILSGLDHPTSGTVRVGGVDLAGLSRSELARYRQRTVGLVFQQFHLIPYLTAVENVMLAQYVLSMTDRHEAEEALRRGGLGAGWAAASVSAICRASFPAASSSGSASPARSSTSRR